MFPSPAGRTRAASAPSASVRAPALRHAPLGRWACLSRGLGRARQARHCRHQVVHRGPHARQVRQEERLSGWAEPAVRGRVAEEANHHAAAPPPPPASCVSRLSEPCPQPAHTAPYVERGGSTGVTLAVSGAGRARRPGSKLGEAPPDAVHDAGPQRRRPHCAQVVPPAHTNKHAHGRFGQPTWMSAHAR